MRCKIGPSQFWKPGLTLTRRVFWRPALAGQLGPETRVTAADARTDAEEQRANAVALPVPSAGLTVPGPAFKFTCGTAESGRRRLGYTGLAAHPRRPRRASDRLWGSGVAGTVRRRTPACDSDRRNPRPGPVMIIMIRPMMLAGR